jgi:hypothetical protein
MVPLSGPEDSKGVCLLPLLWPKLRHQSAKPCCLLPVDHENRCHKGHAIPRPVCSHRGWVLAEDVVNLCLSGVSFLPADPVAGPVRRPALCCPSTSLRQAWHGIQRQRQGYGAVVWHIIATQPHHILMYRSLCGAPYLGKLVHTQILPIVKMVDIARWVYKACLNWGAPPCLKHLKRRIWRYSQGQEGYVTQKIGLVPNKNHVKPASYQCPG